MEEVESEIGLLQEETPHVIGEIRVDAHQDDKEMIFEGVDGPFRSITVMDIQRNELVGNFPVLLNNTLALGADFIVEDLEVNLVAARGEMMHGGVVSIDVILVLLGFEWCNEDGVGITVVCSHCVLVFTA